MKKGIVFDIKEFAVHDGPGIRLTIFMKGCPLACAWCHNPEGLSARPGTMRSAVGERVVGTEYTSEALAGIISAQADILRMNEGGVTFSGGEPLMQAEFVADVIDRLAGLHVLLDTSGYGMEADFLLVAERSDLVYFDVKLVDSAVHRRYTGADNGLILKNLRVLSSLGVPFVIRIPLVPGITDTDENLAAIAAIVRGLSNLARVDLLPYNRAAGGKYAACGMTFKADWDHDKPVNANMDIFVRAGLEARVV